MAVEGGAEAVQEGDGAETRAEERPGSGVRHETGRVAQEMTPVDSGKPSMNWEQYRGRLAAGTIQPLPAHP